MNENLESGSRVRSEVVQKIDGVADSPNGMMLEVEKERLAGRKSGTKKSWENNTNTADKVDG